MGHNDRYDIIHARHSLHCSFIFKKKVQGKLSKIYLNVQVILFCFLHI